MRMQKNVRTKTCSMCHEEFCVDEFYKRSGSNKLMKVCKTCHKKRCEVSRKNNYPAALRRSRKYYESNKESINKRTKEWRKNNKERIIKTGKEWRKNNKERVYNSKLIYRYNITIDDYNELLNKQNGVCAICGNNETVIHGKSGELKPLSVDHCHVTGKVRGLLCSSCNLSLGGFKDNVKTLKSAIKYLKDNKDEKE